MSKLSRKDALKIKDVSIKAGQELLRLGEHYGKTIRVLFNEIEDLKTRIKELEAKKEEAPSES